MRRRAFLKSTTHSFIPITNAVVTCSNATYNGNSQVAQNISVVLNGLTLVENTDYVISVNSGGVNAGSYPVVVSGIGNYEGTASGTFVIDSKYVYNPTITISPTSYTYDGSQKKPSVVSVKDGSVEIPSSEYTVSYGSNVNTGTGVVYISDVSGGNYDVNGSVNFTINKAQGQILEIAYSILNLHYNGEYQDLCTPASGTSVIMYNVNGGPFSTEIPQGKDASVSNLITYYSAENANYTSSVTDSFYAASIKKAVLTLEYANEPITTVNECETVNNPCIIVDSGGTIVNYYDGELIYSSSNENVAIVDSGGTVTGINQGNASITCSAASTNNCWITTPEDQKLTYSVNVINAPTHLDGAYIENTNGDLFSASCWPTKGTGQVNSIVVIDGSWKRRVYVDETYNMERLSYQSGYQVPGVSAATSMDDGEYNTNIIEPLLDGDGMIMRDFTVGGHTYLPSYEEMLTLLNYKDQIDECRVAIGKQATPDDVLRWWTSTYWGESYYAEAGDWNTCVYGVNGKGAMIRRNMGYTLRIGKYN